MEIKIDPFVIGFLIAIEWFFILNIIRKGFEFSLVSFGISIQLLILLVFFVWIGNLVKRKLEVRKRKRW